jgi:hypothetical protein
VTRRDKLHLLLGVGFMACLVAAGVVLLACGGDRTSAALLIVFPLCGSMYAAAIAVPLFCLGGRRIEKR